MLKMDDFWVFLILLFVFLFINYSDNKVLEGWADAAAVGNECARVTVMCSGNATGSAVDEPNGTLTYTNTDGSWVKSSGDCLCDTDRGFTSAPRASDGKCECENGKEYCPTAEKCMTSWGTYATAASTTKPLGVRDIEWTTNT